MQQIVDPVLLLPTLDDPAPQMVKQLPDILHFLRAFSPDPEQAIEVPKILPVDVPLQTSVREPQLVEQLVEVPTIVSFSSLQRIAEQNVDIPVVGGSGTGGSLSSFLPGQHYSMTAEQFQGFSPGQSSSKRTANKIADIPVPSGGPHDFPQTLHCAGVSSDLPDEANQWVFFALFPGLKKVRRSRAPRGRNWVRSRAHGRHELSWLGAWWSRRSTWVRLFSGC